MSDSILRVENVTMQFGGVVAVDNLSLEVNRGEIVSVIGPNGAGKTTCFNVITGVYAPTNGAVFVGGEKIIENHPQGKQKAGYKGQNGTLYKRVLAPRPDAITKLGLARTFQNIRLWKSQTVFENVLIAKHMRARGGFFPAALHLNGKAERAMRRETDELLDILGLQAVRNDLSTSLPYGEQRRLEIARAMATKPQLLLLDEPAAGMNPQETKELTAFISRVRDEFSMSILMIEHHMDLVMDISDRIYVLDFGRLIASGVPAEVQNNPAVIAAYLGAADEEDLAEAGIDLEALEEGEVVLLDEPKKPAAEAAAEKSAPQKEENDA